MSLYRRKNSPYWWTQFSIRGVKFRRSTGCRRESEACEAQARLIMEAESAVGPARAKPLIDARGDLVRLRWKGARDRAKRFGVPMELSEADILALLEQTEGRCQITGIRFNLDDRRGPWTPSLDRIDPSKGYTVENCRFVCLAVNQAMGKWGEEVLAEIGRALWNKKRQRAKK